MNYVLILSKNNEVVDKYKTHFMRRFLKKIRTINWEIKNINAYLKLTYDSKLKNEGNYANKEDFWIAFDAFNEVK